MHVQSRHSISPSPWPCADAVGAADEHARTRRGAVLGKCIGISPFRECGGGEALRSSAASYDRFDQYDYRRMRTAEGRGTCEGIAREALRRIDRSDDGQPLSLSTAVREMRADANRGGSAATEMFGRVGTFHDNPGTLAFRRYREGPFVDVSSGATRDERIVSLLADMRQHLGVRDVAFLRLGVVAPGTDVGRYGHVLAVQRMPQDRYTIFDPNNGAFAYPGQRDMEGALRGYLDRAFTEAGLEVIPDGIEYYSTSAPQRGPSLAPTGPSPADVPESRVARAPDDGSPTLRAYSATADASNGSSGDALSAAAGQRRVMADMCSGLAVYAIADIACGRSTDLMSATESLRQDLSDATRRSTMIRTIGDLQEQNQYAFVAPIANRLRHAGGSAIRPGADLIGDLRQQFADAYFRDNAIRGYLNDFAEIGLTFRGNAHDAGASGNSSDADSDREEAEGHSIVVQRLRPSTDYEHDEYQIYDANFGAFRYTDFAQMSAALRGLFETGYLELGGIDHADTTFFADLGSEQRAVRQGYVHGVPRESPVACMPLGSVERALGIGGSPAMTPPHAALPTPLAPPDVGPPRLPLYPGHDELKRGLQPAADRKPCALFRPSSVRPETVKARGGFDSEETKLRDIDMNLHDADLASRPHVTDSAGYLGTFRSERVALGRLPRGGARFIYYVAPAPNMIDVRASLGSGARAPETGEVAAMGRIDYTQIRGWRPVENGVLGEFVANPGYRWDVYDQTRIARAQPQVARFPVTSDRWQQAGLRKYVSGGGDADARRFKQDPNVVQAVFYNSAWQKVRELQMRQAMGVDYRGPLTLQAYGGSRWRTHIFVDERANVLADSAYTRFAARPGNRHEFTIGDDGRFHVAGDDRSVLRVGNDGYIYLGRVPDDPASLNGVFAYDGRHLIHQEDDKFLTIGKTVFTPFVTTEDCGSRSDWRLERPDRRRAVPPKANLHSFRGMQEGSSEQLYAFECDPDSALPDSADHFVTSVRGNAYHGDFSAYVDRITAGDVRDAARLLDAGQAAWLFRDGYYAVPDGAGGLEVRTLGGKAVWRSADAFAAGKGGTRPDLPLRTAASYRIGNDTWQRILRRENLRAQLVAMMAQAYLVN